MRILLLIVQFPPDTNPTGRLMAQVVAGLRARGHQVDVITAFPHYARFAIEPAFRGRLIDNQRTPQGDTTRLWVFTTGSKGRMLHRLASYLSFNMLATVVALLRRSRPDVILAPNGSFFTGIAAAIVGVLRGCSFIYNVQDLYPEVPVQAGQLSNPWLIAGMRHLERAMYRAAALNTVVAPSFVANLLGKGIAPARIVHVPNFVDTAFIRPLPRHNSLSAAHGLDAHFVVSYAGNLGYVYDLHTVLDAAALLAAHPDILFLIVGEGVSKAELQARAVAMGLRNVRFLPFQPEALLPELRAVADVQLSPHRPGTTGYSLPSKIYEVMASGRPLLVAADPGSDVATLVESAGCGFSLPPGDPQRLADAILALRADPDLRTAMGAAGRRYAEAHVSSAAVVNQYEQLLRAVADQGLQRRKARRAARPLLSRSATTRTEESRRLP